MDRYAYGNNNPVRYNDPSGHCPICIVLGIFVAAAIILPNVTTATPNAQQTQHMLTETPEQVKAEIKQSVDASMTILGAGLGVTEAYIVGSQAVDYLSASKLPPNGVNLENQTSGSYSTIKAGNEIQTYYPPNNGFKNEPSNVTLKSGTLIDRYGFPQGRFASPYGTPAEMRALPPGAIQNPYSVYRVTEPIEVQAGEIAPWFGQIGGGTQYLFPKSIQSYLESGALIKAISK